MLVVLDDKLLDGLSHVVGGIENSAVDRLLLEGANVTLGDAVGLRLADDREAGRDTPVLELPGEIDCRVLGAVIVVDHQTAGDVAIDATKVPEYALTDWLHGRVAVARGRHMRADAFGVEMIHGDENPHPSVVDRQHFGAV